MRRLLSLIIIVLLLFELFPVNTVSAQEKLKVGFIGVFIDDKEMASLSKLVSPIFSTSKFFTWEKFIPDTPISDFWGTGKIIAKFQHNNSNVTGRFTLYLIDPISNVEMFILESSGVSSQSSGTVTNWEPLEKEAFLNGISSLSQKLDDLWRSNSIVTYYDENVFECDLGKSYGIVEGSILSVFRNNRLVAKGKVTSLDQKISKVEVFYRGEDYPPRLGDIVKIAYIPPAPEVSFINQATPILNAIAGIAILAGLVTLYNIAKANATPWIKLISPANGREFKQGDPIDFFWSSNDTTIAYYHIIVSDSSNNNIIWDKVTSSPSTSITYDGPSLSPGTYTWKVIGIRNDGSSIEGARTFIVTP
jgi:hypothetical protein